METQGSKLILGSSQIGSVQDQRVTRGAIDQLQTGAPRASAGRVKDFATQILFVAGVGLATIASPVMGVAQCSEQCKGVVQTLPDKGPLEIDDQVNHLWLKFQYRGTRYLAIQNTVEIKPNGVDIYRYKMTDEGPNVLFKGADKVRLKLTDKEKVALIGNSCVSEEIVGRLSWMRGHVHPPPLLSSAEEAQAWNRHVEEERSRPGPCSVPSSLPSGVADGQIVGGAQSGNAEETNIAVPANRPWTPTGIQVRIGDDVTISAVGVIQTNLSGAKATPAGTPPDCMDIGKVNVPFVAPQLPCWSLLGRIGPSGSIFEVGAGRHFMSSANGELYLGVNDNFFGDNSGSWSATILGGHATQSELDSGALRAGIPSQWTIYPKQAWTRTGIELHPGDLVSITARGEMRLGSANASPDGLLLAAVNGVPESPGLSCEDSYGPMYNLRTDLLPSSALPCGSLIGRIGEQGLVFEIGTGATFHSTSSGALYLGINYTEFAQSAGQWGVTTLVNSLNDARPNKEIWGPGQTLGLLHVVTTPSQLHPGESYTVSGEVKDVNGNAVADATVQLWCSFGGTGVIATAPPWPCAVLNTRRDGSFLKIFEAPNSVGSGGIRAMVVGAYPGVTAHAGIEVVEPEPSASDSTNVSVRQQTKGNWFGFANGTSPQDREL
ncbi:MAG TPA: hypothetical protein VKY92_11270, partial [Verrucomicrobiae bacterium]|nr:hypothetical protein [Verrucomicrobiae bacterium]